MALTLGQVVDRVRDAHPAFDPRIVGNQALARFFDRYQRQLVYKILEANPDALLVETTVAFLATMLMGQAGYDLPTNLGIRPGLIRFTNDATTFGELTLVKFQDRMSPYGKYPAYMRGGKLFLIGTTDGWSQVASFDLAYIAMPVLLTALTDAMTVPDSAFDALVAAGCNFAAQKVADRPDVKIDVKRFYQDAETAEEMYLRGLGLHNQATIHYVKEAW